MIGLVLVQPLSLQLVQYRGKLVIGASVATVSTTSTIPGQTSDRTGASTATVSTTSTIPGQTSDRCQYSRCLYN